MDFLSDKEPYQLILYGVFAVVLIVMFFVRKRGSGDLMKWAAENEFKYSPRERMPTLGLDAWKYTIGDKHSDAWFRKYAEFYPFDSNSYQRVHELFVREEDGMEWRFFRFNVDNSAEGSGDWYWICVIEGSWDFPAVQVRPVGFKDKLVGLFGKSDIETGLGEFDDAFHVSGESETFARDLLSSDMKRFLIDQGTFRWQVNGPFVMLVWPHSYDVKDVELMLFAMRRFLGHIPASVR